MPKATAEKFGELNILYNDRICPVQTYALDFCKKIYGARSYKGLTAEQVLTGWIFYGDEWASEPFIKVKSGELKTAMNLPDYCSINQFFNKEMGGYIIGQYVQEILQWGTRQVPSASCRHRWKDTTHNGLAPWRIAQGIALYLP